MGCNLGHEGQNDIVGRKDTNGAAVLSLTTPVSG
jgi:hypothetical protein